MAHSGADLNGRWPAFVVGHADKMRGGYVVRDANGQALVYLYSRENEAEALQAKVLTADLASLSSAVWRGSPGWYDPDRRESRGR